MEYEEAIVVRTDKEHAIYFSDCRHGTGPPVVDSEIDRSKLIRIESVQALIESSEPDIAGEIPESF
jgi:hypothetical protein